MEQVREFFDKSFTLFGDYTLSVGQLVLTPLLFVTGYVIARLIGRLIVKRMTKANLNPDLIHLFQRVYFIFVLTILAFALLELLNVPLTAFAFVSGAVAIGIGFGAQNIINNFISGWILMWEKPIRIGDFLEVGNAKGTVEAINTRSTRIKRIDGVHMLIPNSQLLENTVVNWTLVDKLTRTSVRVGVAYGSPVQQVKSLLLEAVGAIGEILDEPKPVVVFDDFGESSLDFEILFWALAAGEKELRSIRSDLRFEIDRLFRDNDITIAFPQRDVHLDNLSPVTVRVLDK